MLEYVAELREAINEASPFLQKMNGDRSRPATLDYFMRDYVAHLKHHLAQLGIGLD